jgi:hypothetical protein
MRNVEESIYLRNTRGKNMQEKWRIGENGVKAFINW